MATGQRRNDLEFSSTSVTDPFGINNVLLEPPAGFGRGNAGGLSAKQLYDMTEIWTCLGVLLQPLHGRCTEAREAGIFKGTNVPVGDTAKEEKMLGQFQPFRHWGEKEKETETNYTQRNGPAMFSLSGCLPSYT